MKNEKEYFANFRDARLVQLIKVEVNEGEGTEEDPIARVVYFVDPKNGQVVAKRDIIGRERQFAGQDQIFPLTP